MIRKLPSAISRDLFRTRLSDLTSQYFIDLLSKLVSLRTD
jgi:hypothetical protein